MLSFGSLLDISRYREAKLVQGTDWSGFYDDPGSKRIAMEVLEGINYTVLYRFFRQGVA